MTADAELLTHARSRVGALLCKKYKIEGVLGIGGMATVYSAVHRNGRRVAVKLLHPELSIRAEIRKRFLREGHAASAVNHPGVVVVLDDDVAEDGAAFLVLELLEGQQLEELWEQNGRRLPVNTIMAVARELCDVLAAAHRAGVVHRDIKPANLFVTRAGQLKVLDFGIARVRDAATTAGTQTGSVFGTPAFMAPEQASGRVSLVDGQTDVWAVGATMFTLLTGLTVHEGESGQHLAMLSATRPARSLASVMPEAKGELVAVVDGALAFDKASRWPSAEAMRDALVDAGRAMFGNALPTLLLTTDEMHTWPATPLERLAGSEPPSQVLALPVLGSTTSAPVSSEATTRRRGAGAYLTQVMSQFSALMRLGVARTVPARSPARDSSRARSRLPLMHLLVGVFVAGVVGLTAAAAVRLRSTREAPIVSSSGRIGRPPSDLAPPPGVVAYGAASSAAAQTAVLPLASSGIAPAATMDAGTAPTRTFRPANSAMGTAPQSRCTPPYFFDTTGKKRWKAECL